MEIYRSPMEKILKQMEDDTIITNPNEPVRTFFRKVVYRFAWIVDRVHRLFIGGRDNHTQK